MDYAVARRRMVENQIMRRNITDQSVLDAMLKTPRHLFVDEGLRPHAYSDASLPIGEKQTISQPFMVASMTAALGLQGQERILEIGTGSGYQTAILSHLVSRVYTIERIASLAGRARRIFDQLSLTNVNLKVGDGTIGWLDQAPFDGIIVTAGAPDVPTEFLDQLAVGAALIVPVGPQDRQVLLRLTRTEDGRFSREELMDCRFVPLIGEKVGPTMGSDNGRVSVSPGEEGTSRIKRIYDWVLSWAETPYAVPALVVLAFAEASFFPIPPDVLLIALSLARPQNALRYAFAAALGSTCGGILGYAIGYGLWTLVADWFFTYIPGFTPALFQQVGDLFVRYDFWTVFAAGFTPIPYKVFTIAAGVFKINLPIFILASLVSRSLRFYLVAWLLRRYGDRARAFIERYFNLLTLVVLILLVVALVFWKFFLHTQ